MFAVFDREEVPLAGLVVGQDRRGVFVAGIEVGVDPDWRRRAEGGWWSGGICVASMPRRGMERVALGVMAVVNSQEEVVTAAGGSAAALDEEAQPERKPARRPARPRERRVARRRAVRVARDIRGSVRAGGALAWRRRGLPGIKEDRRRPVMVCIGWVGGSFMGRAFGW
jgi:hypothetical protein